MVVRSALGECAHRRGAPRRRHHSQCAYRGVVVLCGRRRLLCVREKRSMEREGQGANGLRVSRGGHSCRFCSREMQGRPSDQDRRLAATGLAPGLGGHARRTALPAQAQVVAWVGAVGARAKLGRAVLPVGPQCSKALSHFPFFIFQ